MWRLLTDENVSADSAKSEVLDILLGILRVRSKRATSELRKISVEMAWYICVTEPEHKGHVMRRGLHSSLLRLMLDLDDRDRVPPFLRVVSLPAD